MKRLQVRLKLAGHCKGDQGKPREDAGSPILTSPHPDPHLRTIIAGAHLERFFHSHMFPTYWCKFTKSFPDVNFPSDFHSHMFHNSYFLM